jgi:hypothetical protein
MPRFPRPASSLLARFAFFAALLAAPLALRAETFDVGGKNLSVPAPAGYVRVGPEMSRLHRFVEQLSDPMNDTLAFYIPEESVALAKSGEIPDLRRYFMLKVNKDLKNRSVSTPEFVSLKREVAAENDKIFEQVRAAMPGYMDQISKNLGKEFDTHLSIKIGQIAPYPPHLDAEQAWSYSMLINYGVRAGQDTTDSLVVVTNTFLNTSGRLLFLYAYGPRPDLEWTRSASEQWQGAILAENEAPPAARGFDWSRVAFGTLLGALLGGLLSLAMHVRRKKAAPSPAPPA